MPRKRTPPAFSRAFSRPGSAEAIRPWQWFLLAAAAPIVLCAARLNLDLWHDEIYTLTMFVAAGPRQIVSDYSAPNNHVLYSLVLWPVHLISNSNFALRLPSLAFAVGTLWMTFRAGCRLGDAKLGVFATMLLGLNQMFLIHAIQVRGYGLSMFLFAWLANLAIAGGSAACPSRLAQIALAGAAFLYVMPTNLLLFLPLAAAALTWPAWAWQRRPDEAAPLEPVAKASRPWTAGVAWAAALGLAALCYAPIARQVLERRGERAPFTLAALLASIADFLRPATHDLLPLAPFFLLGLAVWVVRRLRGRKAASPAALLLAAGVFAGSFLLGAGLGIGPFPRNFCPLLPLLALAEAWTLGELASAIRWKNERGELAAAAASALLIAAVLAPQLATYPRRLAAYCREHRGAHDGYFNYYAADYRVADVVERIKQLTAGGRPFRVCYAAEDQWNLIYYFRRAGQPLAR
ncbi:MAG TPA: hypothetical protein VN699_12115, partial [Pirellulales bacterium]|nr:hypothetical protein [Pirellulales bacterium]